MASITFYGGVNEIGGNKFLLEDQGSEVFFDFGKNFGKEKLYFEEPFIKAREEKHLLNLGILPPIKGLYKNDAGTYDLDLDGVIISHPHMDHYDSIRFIKDDYPIFCGEDTKHAILAREFCSQSIGKNYEIGNLTATRGKEVFKSFNTFKSGGKSEAGNIRFKPYPVDHSVPGAYGFVIETKNGNVVYTGDFRLHGSGREKTLDFIKKAKEAEPEALLIEGTHICECKLESEEEVKEKVGNVINNTGKLVLAGFSIGDTDRINTFYKAAKDHDRKLAIPTKQAYIIDSLCKHEGILDFSLKDPNILIFQKEKKRYGQYEKEIHKRYSTVSSEDISSMQEEVVMVASLYDMNEVAEIKPESGSSYILSQSEPFNEEMEISFDKLLNWLSFFGIPLYQAHASGHATPHEIKQVINEISPKKVIPIHTERPELFKGYISDLGFEIKIPYEGGKVEL